MKNNKIIKVMFVILSVVLVFTSCAGSAETGKQAEVMQKPTTEENPISPPTSPEAAQSDSDYAQAPAADTPQSPTSEGNYEGETGNNSSETYLTIRENNAVAVEDESVVTLSLKVDTASYSNVQRYIENGQIPPTDAVKTEELVNYFNYDTNINIPKGEPFGIYTEVGPSPMDSSKNLFFVRIKSEEIEKEDLPSSNLTFLIDTSGSMYSHDKLPLLQEAFSLLVETLDGDDTVSIVTYAGSSDVLLKGESGSNKKKILAALDSLEASGSTAGADGINTAYELAQKNFIRGGNNRVILATDGDFNVGASSSAELSKLIEAKSKEGVYLSVLGFGTGNIRDDIMETLSKDGNGNYNYIYDVDTAKKVLVEEIGSNMFVVAQDVKAQVEFNPQNVSNYRLIGYENRMLDNRDFEDDTKDAGEIGVGTDVVMLFEIDLQGANSGNLKYEQDKDKVNPTNEHSGEICEVRIRYKDPGETKSKEILHQISKSDVGKIGSSDFLFASAVASFSHILRDSDYTGDANINNVIALAKDGQGKDSDGYRKDFVELVEKYERLI